MTEGPVQNGVVKEPTSLEVSAEKLAQLSLEEIQALRLRAGGRNRGPRASAIERQRRLGDSPLSFAQERLWFLDQLALVGSAYNTVIALRFQGVLHPGALERSLSEVIRRHESLRTRFKAVDGVAIQIVDPPEPMALPIRTVVNIPEEDRIRCIGRLSDEERQQPFDLEKGPIIRATLLELAADDHALLLSIHHIACDGWSFGILNRELAALYSAFSRGESSSLPELEAQYIDYTLWQRQWLQGDLFQKQLGYWREHLSGAPPQLELPTDRPRPALESYKGAIVKTSISSELSGKLKELGHAYGATLFMVMLAAYQVLLSRWSGQKDIVVGTPVAGRGRQELEGMVGFFVNTLALRTAVLGDSTFREHLIRVRELTLGAYANQDLPFESLVKELRPDRDLARQAVFQVMLTLQHIPQEPPSPAGLRWTWIEGENSTTHFDLNLSLTETHQGISAEFQYATDLFDADTIARMSTHFRRLLEGVVTDPECQIRCLPMLEFSERQLVLKDWNDTTAPVSHDKTMHRLFEEQTRLTPHSLAATCGDASLSYAELNRRANQLARCLISKGVGPDRLVALCMERGTDILMAVLGTLKAGGAYVPLDTTNPPARLQHILNDAQPEVIVTQKNLLDRISSTTAEVIDLDNLWDQLAEYDDDDLDTRGLPSNPDNLAYVIYTSGSTGVPKGVMVTHRNIVNYSIHTSRQFDLRTGNGSLISTSFSFDLMLTGLYPPLLSGRTVRLVPPHASYDLADEVLRCDNLAPLKLTPSHLPMLELALEKGQLDGKVGVLVLGGEPLLASALKPWRERLPGTRIFNHYGPTEATVGCVINEVTELAPGRVPIGRPVSNVRIFILDESMQPVPVGVAGDIYVGGVGVARGYLNRPDLTAERFRPDPFSDSPQDRLYATGDRGRWLREGKIDCLGRADQQIKVRGYRIELGEIESHLVQNPEIKGVAVVARNDVDGQGAELISYVVLEKASGGCADEFSSERNDSATLLRLREYLKTRLPEYMVPSVWMLLKQLPLTPNGKLDRAALPIPEQRVDEASVRPRTDLERTLADIWAEVLKRAEVGIRESFFDLGGHSLLATRVISRIRETLNIDLPLRTLFELPTVEELAKRVAAEIERQEMKHSAGTADLSERLRREIGEMSDEEVAARIDALQREIAE